MQYYGMMKCVSQLRHNVDATPVLLPPKALFYLYYGKGLFAFGVFFRYHYLRACLKRDDSRGVEAVHLGYEKDSIVSNRSNRPSMGLYQRTDSCCKARRTSTNAGHAKHRECHPLSGSDWVSMEDAAA